jgi:peptide/nickel transport system permease protein
MKGVSESMIIWKHSLRNALIPVLGFGGVYVALFLTAAVTTEVVFAWPGLGRLVYTSVLARDFPVVQGGVTFFVFVAIFVNLLVDIMYSILDPRIRLD